MNMQKYAAPGLIVGSIVFGMGSVIVATVPVGAYAIAFWRLCIAGIIFWLLARRFGQRLSQSKKGLCCGLVAGAFLGIDLSLWHESVYAVGPGISTLLNSLQIFFLAAIGFFRFGEKQSRLQLASLFIAITGVALIGSPEFSRNHNAAWGFISGILSGAMLAASMVYVRKTHETEPTPLFALMMLVSLGGMAAALPPALIFNTDSLFPATPRDIGLVLIYGAVMQCFAWGLIAYAVPLLPLALTGLLLLSEPVAALFIDYFFLGKTINGLQWSGAALTMLAIYLGSLKPKPPKA